MGCVGRDGGVVGGIGVCQVGWGVMRGLGAKQDQFGSGRGGQI